MISMGDLAQFTGTEQYYFHPGFKWMNYTDGVKYFAENAGGNGAYWFIGLVATEFFHHPDRDRDFVTITLRVTDADTKGVITMDDGNGNVLWNYALDYTDCDAGEWKFYLIGNVLLLPSEY